MRFIYQITQNKKKLKYLNWAFEVFEFFFKKKLKPRFFLKPNSTALTHRLRTNSPSQRAFRRIRQVAPMQPISSISLLSIVLVAKVIGAISSKGFLHRESKNKILNSCPQLLQMLTVFRNSYAGRLSGKFAAKSYLNISPLLKYVTTVPLAISMFKKSQCSRSN